MIGKFKKITDGLIIFSALFAEFEKLDFKSDALAGVRSNYFNSHNAEQHDTTEVCIDSDLYSLSYKMSENASLLWKVSRNNRPYQSVKRLSDEIYSVLYYEENGIISKRVYFDSEHNWVRTEYFDKQNETHLAARLYPKNINGIVVLMSEHFNKNAKPCISTLYPSEEPKGKRCAALVYSNVGMLWYDEAFRPENINDCTEPTCASKGFDFTELSFEKSAVSAAFNIANSDYLTDKDVPIVCKESIEVSTEKTSDSYSAYDKIEKILSEAHKSNKDLFGEIITHAGDVVDESDHKQNSDIDEITDCKADNKKTCNEIEFLNECNSEENSINSSNEINDNYEEENSDAETVSSLLTEEYECISDETDNCLQDDDNVCENNIEINDLSKNRTEGSKPISCGKYYYYGSVSADGNRTGRGRTVSADGTTLYEGDYKLDKRHGFGVSYYKNGSINYSGSWNENARCGCGAGYRLSDGTLHAGNWLDNTPHGYGARFSSNGDFMDLSSYQNGLKHGKSISFDEKGRVIISVWENGVKISEKLIED